MAKLYGELPKKLYVVRVPELATYDPYELEIMGFPLMEVNGEIKQNNNSTVTVELPLSRIIDIYASGFKIQLLDKTQISEIYNFLEEYLNSERQIGEYSMNRKAVEDDRAYEIDKFASEIFNLNRQTIVKNALSTTTSFDIGFSGMGMPIHTTRLPLVDKEETFGIMSGYEIDPYAKPVDIAVTYINNDLPTIDISKVERKPIKKHYTL